MSFWECPKCGGIPGVTRCCSDAALNPPDTELDRELERTRNGAKNLERTLEAAKAEIDQLRQALKDCQTVAIMRGDSRLPDCIDNTGVLYQSAHLAALLEKK